MAQLPAKPGFITVEIDLAKQQQIRQNFPVDKHQKMTITMEKFS